MCSIRTVASRKADQFAVPVQSQQGQTAHKVYLFSFNQITITSRNSREAFVVKTSRLCIKAALTSRQFRLFSRSVRYKIPALSIISNTKRKKHNAFCVLGIGNEWSLFYTIIGDVKVDDISNIPHFPIFLDR